MVHFLPLQICLAAVLAIIGHGGSWVIPDFWLGAWIGQMSVIFLAAKSRPKHAFALGMVVGLGINLLGFHWAPQALVTCLDASLWQAQLLFFALSLWEAVAFAIFMTIVSKGCEAGINGLWLAPLAWACVEFAWPKIFPWTLAYTQLAFLPLIQIAEFTGSHGIGFIITAVAAIPTAIYLAYRTNTPHHERRAAWNYGLVVVGLSLVTILYGVWKLHSWPQWESQYAPFRVAVLQVDSSSENCEVRLRERTLALRQSTDLACWPECSVGIYSSSLTSFADPELTLGLSRESHYVLQPTRDCACDVLMGGKSYRPGTSNEGSYSVTAFLVDPQQAIRGSYHKRTLLPFGEYVPGEAYFPTLREWATLSDVIEPGRVDQPPLVSSSGAKLGVIICYEDILAGNARLTCNSGAELLISIINDARFENPLTLEQHRRLAVMRAVENQRYFLRSAATGVTCIVAPTGQVLAELPIGSEGTLERTIALIPHQTIYTQLGDYFPLLCCAMCVCCLGWTCIPVSKKRTEIIVSPEMIPVKSPATV